MCRLSSLRASSRSWTSTAKPATAPVGSGTLTMRSIRRSPWMIAGCICGLRRPLSCACFAAAACAVLALAVDQLGRAGDHFGGILAFDGFDERTVDEPEAKVGPAVPHRERRGFDQVRERIQRGFGLPEPHRQPARSSSPALVSKQPQKHGARRFRRRSWATANLEHAARAATRTLSAIRPADNRAASIAAASAPGRRAECRWFRRQGPRAGRTDRSDRDRAPVGGRFRSFHRR